ncbi:protein-S-isoprenylcysteine O-methyltransferase Ste14 [Nakamurella sp. UYEF19]|uniref:hypothetical protein n=1 Tax=Nakamurella sp. UYEF19 TaxID=1756392 RepID=UPI0033988B56
MSSPGRPSAVPASGNTDGAPPVREEPPVRMRTAARSKASRKAAPLAKIGMIVFAIGLVAIFADMILFASGSRDLPLWINLTAMLAPVGLGLGLIAVVRENRSSSPAMAARKAAAEK